MPSKEHSPNVDRTVIVGVQAERLMRGPAQEIKLLRDLILKGKWVEAETFIEAIETTDKAAYNKVRIFGGSCALAPVATSDFNSPPCLSARRLTKRLHAGALLHPQTDVPGVDG